LKNNQKRSAKVLGVIGNFIILYWTWIELKSNMRAGYISTDAFSVLLSVFYMIYAIILMWIGVVKEWVGFRIFAIILFIFVVGKAYLVDIWDLSELIRILAFIILGIVLLGTGYYYTKNSEKIKKIWKD
jgi:uncharacterized membrane protein